MTQLVLKQGDYTVNLNSEIISNIKDRQEYLDVLVDEIIKELKANYKLSEEVEEHIDSVFYAAEIFDCEIDSIFDNPLTDEEVFSFILKDAGLVKEFNPFEIIPGSQEYMDYLNQNGRIVWSLDAVYYFPRENVDSELFEKFKGNTELFKQYLLDNKIDVCVFVEMGKRGEEFDNIQHVIDANYRLTGPGLDDFNHKKGRLNRGHGISNKTMTIVVDPYLIAKTEKQRKSEKLDKFLKDFYGSEYDKMSEREKSDRLLAIKNMLDLKASDSRSLDPEGETYAINGDMSFETNEDLLERLLKNVKSNDDMFNDIFNEYADVGCDVISVKYYVEHIDTDKVVIDTLSPRDFVIPEYETLTSSEALRRVLASVS